MIRQRHQKPEMLAAVMPTRPEEAVTSAGRNAMMQRNGPNLQPLAKSGRHRKTPALHLSAAPCQEEATIQEPRQPDLQAQAPAQAVEADRELENLPPPRRPLKLAPLAPSAMDAQQPVKARGSGGKEGGGAAAGPPPQEPKVGVRKVDGLHGADACPRKMRASPAREASPARSPERPPLCRMRPIVDFPKAASSNQQQLQQQQPALGAKTLLLPVPQSERPRQRSPGRDLENFPSSTPPPTPSSKRSGPLSLSVSPSRLPPDALQQVGTQAGAGGRVTCAPTSSSCSSECGRARPRLRRIPRLEEDQGRSAPAQAAAPGASVAGLPPQEREREREEEEAKPGHLAQAGGQHAERAERALREATRVLEKASRRKPALLDGPGKASRKMVVNVIPAAVH